MTAEAASTRPAIIDADGRYTYDELTSASRCVAGALLNGAEDLDQARVAFLIPPGFAYAAVQRGIWSAGAVAVPLAVSHPPPELDYVIRDAGASIVVCADAAADVLRPLAEAAGARLLTVTEALAASTG